MKFQIEANGLKIILLMYTEHILNKPPTPALGLSGPCCQLNRKTSQNVYDNKENLSDVVNCTDTLTIAARVPVQEITMENIENQTFVFTRRLYQSVLKSLSCSGMFLCDAHVWSEKMFLSQI